MKKIFTFILALIAGAGAMFAENGSCGLYAEWELTDGMLIISGTNPDQLGGMFNYDSDNRAPWYKKRAEIESIQVLNGIDRIGKQAFIDCSNVTYVSIGKDVGEIKEDAFRNCSNLAKVTIPANVKTVGPGAFRNCAALSYVHLSEGIKTIDGAAFAQCPKLASITIPSTLTSVADNAFSASKALETVIWNVPDYSGSFSSEVHDNRLFPYARKVTFGDKVETIPVCMFARCDSLRSMICGKNVRRIKTEAFFGCDNLTDVQLNDKLELIGSAAFRYCIGLKSIVIPADTVEFYAFKACHALESVTFGEKVKYIHAQAFEEALSVKSVVWNIRNYDRGYIPKWFSSSTTIKSFVFGENVESIPGELCADMRFESVTIPENVKYIGKDAFKDCKSLTSVVWNARACNANEYADESPFYPVRKNITSFVIGDKVTFIPSYLCYEMGKLPMVTLPASVISIGNHAFDGCTKWAGQDLVIPNDVMTLGEYAFANCNLTTVTIGSSVNSIGKYAFMGSDNMTSVYNESVTPQGIAANVFGDLNKSACDLYVPENSIPAYQGAEVWKNFRSFNPLCRLGSGTTSSGIQWSLSCSGHLSFTGTGVIPNYTTYLGDYYQLCTAPWFGDSKPNHTVKSAEISDGITRVGDYTFWNCQDMTNVYIPNSVTSIGEFAFYYDKALQEVTLSDNIESIGQQAFTQCISLTSITLPIHLKSIESTAFALCSGLTSVVIPEEVEAIHDEAFGYCSNLTELTIPASVTTIDERAFTYCTKLTTVWNNATTPQEIKSNVFGALDKSKCTLYVPKNAVAAYMKAPVWKEFNIKATECVMASGSCGRDGDNVTWSLSCDGDLTIRGTGEMYWEGFYVPWDEYKTDIRTVVIGEGVTNLGTYAFANCPNLTSLSIPQSLTRIDRYAFFNCSLPSIELPQSLTAIDDYMFDQCYNLSSITIPSGVTQIGVQAFANCASLSEINLPNTLQTFAACAFMDCPSLQSVTIPASVTLISPGTFANCFGLKSVTNESLTPQSIGNEVFQNLTLSNIRLYVYESALEDNNEAAVWKEFSPIMVIGATAIDQTNEEMKKCENRKFIKDGQIYLMYNGTLYNVQGQIVK